MESTNQIQIEGYIDTEPTIRQTRGAAQTTFAFATYVHNQIKKTDDRETWKVRSFISPTFTGDLHKGDSVVILGKLRNRKVSDGKFDTFILADKIFKKAAHDKVNARTDVYHTNY